MTVFNRRQVMSILAGLLVSGAGCSQSSTYPDCENTFSIMPDSDFVSEITASWRNGHGVAEIEIQFDYSNQGSVDLYLPNDSVRSEGLFVGQSTIKFDLLCERETVWEGCIGAPNGVFEILLRQSGEIIDTVRFETSTDGCYTIEEADFNG